MISDDERREVAERLRKCTPTTSYGQAQGGGWSHLCDMALAVGLKREDEPTAWELAQRLAYYIDPPYPDAMASYKGWRAEVYDPDGVLASPSNVAVDLVRAHADGKMRHSTKEEQNEYSAMLKKMSVEMHTVDRDALLSLADEMDAYSGHFSTGLQECTVQAWAVAIREALGESDG